MSTVTKAPATPGTAIFVPPVISYPIAERVIDELRAEFMPLAIVSIDDKIGFEAVHEARMTIRDKRISIEKRRKELKAHALTYGEQVDGEAKRLTALLEPVEAHLEGEEARYKEWVADKKKAAEAAERAKVDARLAELEACGAMMNPTVVAVLSDDEWAETLANKRQEAAEKKAADEAAAAELAKAEAERAAALRLEQEKLAAERAELERQRVEQEAALAEQRRVEADRLAAASAALETQRQAQQAEQDRQHAERAKLDAEKKRLADEEAERLRKAELERTASEAADRAKQEERQRQENEALAAKNRADAELVASQRADRLRPDRDKLLSVADAVEAIALPRMATGEGIHASALIQELLAATAGRIRDAANMIGEQQP